MFNNHVGDVSGSGCVAPFFSRIGKLAGGRKGSLSILSLVLVMSSVARLSAQTFGDVSGHVSDRTGAAIPQATITLANLATGAVRSTVTTDTGDYTFTAVPPAVYNIQAAHIGFRTSASSNVEVQIQQSLRLDFKLEIGAVTQSVTVSAAGVLLQAENATLGTVVENEAVTQLPLNGRNYLGLVALSSNVDTLSPSSGQAGSRLGGDRAAQSISAGGQRIMFDYYTLDGVNNTDPDFNTYVVLPSIDAIEEFKVQTGIYPAEFGHEASQINVVTKSGSNAYHGALFEFIRNDIADAVPYKFSTVAQKAPFKWNDYGFELDGPIRLPKLFDGRNRFFFMANGEWKVQRQSSQGLLTVPTAAMENGDFSTYPSTIYDPASGDSQGNGKKPFSGNIIPPERIDQISKKFLDYYAAATLSGLNNNYTYAINAPNDRYVFTLRADYNQSAKTQWSFRYSSGNEDQSTTGIKGVGNKILTNYYQYLGSNTRVLTSSLVNEARFGYTHFFNSLGTLSAYTNNAVQALGIPGLNPGAPSTWGIPLASFSGDGFSGIGDVQDGPYVVTDPTWQFVDNVSWVKGKHALRFGFEYNRQTFNQLGNQFSRGNFVFQANATQSSAHTGGDAFADFLLGDIFSSTVAVAIANANYVRNVEAAYIDDTYKITPNVTIAAGLRYELTPPWNDTFGNEFTVYVPQLYAGPQQPMSNWPYFVRQGHCTDPYQGLSINWTAPSGKAGTQATPPPVCSNGLLPDELMHTAYNNWAPRFSVSYSPTSATVVRGGFGLFYNQDIANANFDLARNIAGRVTLTSGQNGGTQGVPTLFWNNAVPGGSGAIAQIPPPYAYAMAYDHKTSYTMQYLLNLQQQMGQNWALEIGYLGGQSRHLFGFRNANAAIPYGYIGNGARTPVSARLPYLNYGVIQLVHDGGMGNYNALSVKATRRFSNGFNLIGSYTYAKSLDDTSGIRTQGFDTLFPQNSDCIPCEYGLSAFDVRHRLVASLLYELPIGEGKLWAPKGIVNAVIGGWQVGSIATLQTGVPGNVSIGGVDNASTANAYDRPNLTGLSPYLSHKSVARWFNPAAFVEAPSGFFGNTGRNAVQGPSIINFDSEVHKQFRMFYSERHQLQFRLEAFNVFNHPNWGMPNLNILAGPVFPGQPGTNAHQNFGTINSTQTPMRQLQLGARYVF